MRQYRMPHQKWELRERYEAKPGREARLSIESKTAEKESYVEKAKTLAALREQIASGSVKAADLAAGYYERIAKVNPRLNVYLSLSRERATEQAAHVDALAAKGDPLPPLAGIPVGIKDVLVMRGAPATAGSKILEGYRPPYDATAVARLEAAGAVLLGKLNCDEFAMGSSNENSAYGPVGNPWDIERVPGGSSGGSAAAVAADLAVATLGTDTGGSIRQPASFCGVVGFKPTYGRVSRYGLIAFASSLDQIGPFTRTVEDCALVYAAIAGHDPRDSTSDPRAVEDPLASLHAGVAGMRLGIPREYLGEGTEPGVRDAVQAAFRVLEAQGATLQEVSLPSTDVALSVYYIIAPAECSSNLARYDGVRFGSRVERPSLTDMYLQTRGEGFGNEVKRRVILGTYALSSGYYDAYYGKAQQVRTLVVRDFDAAFEQVDVLVSPSTPTTAFRIGERADDPMAMYLADLCTIPSDLAGNAALSVPCGLAPDDGLPVGLQVMAPVLADDRMYRVGAAVETALTERWGHPLLAGLPDLTAAAAEARSTRDD